MPVRPPTVAELAELADRHGFALSEADLASFQDLMAGTLASYDVVAALPDPAPPVRHPRTPGVRPGPADDPYGAWYRRTSIPGDPGGPLDGRTVVIKDNTCVAGVPMMNGSAALEGFVPDEDATAVTRLLEAGAQIVGKAVCEDLCFSGASHTSATGPVRNPWDRERTSGGSSSGCAALVAAGEADLGLGGDQGGSVRMPAAFCGIVGHKPTFGLVPYTGAFPIELTIDHLGPMARTVRDAATMLQAIAGPDGADPRQPAGLTVGDYVTGLEDGVEGLTVGVLREGFGWPQIGDPGVEAVAREAAEALAAAGARVVEVSVPAHRDAIHIWNVIAVEGAANQMIRLNGYGMNWKGRYNPSLIAAFHRGRALHADELSETVKLVALLGDHLTAAYGGRWYARARNLAGALGDAYDAALSDCDLLAMPTMVTTATVIPGPGAPREEYVARALEGIVNTAPFNVTGHPAASVPAGLCDGLPVGLMLVGRQFADATVLRAARAVEAQVGALVPPVPQEAHAA